MWQSLPQMNANAHNTPAVSKNLDAEVRARVPAWMKTSVDAVAAERLLDGADIVREAVAEYLARRKAAAAAIAPSAETQNEQVAA